MGGSIGSILGSAIGGLSGGPRGSDMGTIIGMAGGAAVGAVIGSQADQRQQQQVEQYQRDKARRAERRAARSQQQYSIGQSGYDQSDYGQRGYDQPVYGTPNSEDNSDVFDSTNSGDDRLYDFNGKDYVGDYSAQQPTTVMPSSKMEALGSNWSYSPTLEIVNARFVDSNEDNTLNRNETCKVIFEIMNRGNSPVYDVVPTVVETTGNKHIYISPSIHVEKITPGRGIRYTAMVKADNRLKNGMAHFCVSVIHEGKSISKVNEFNIPTRR
jgi:putative lipoprotein